MQIPPIIDLIQGFPVFELVPLQNKLNGPLKDGLPQLASRSLVDPMHLCCVHLVPQPIGSQQQAGVGGVQLELGDEWHGREVGPREVFYFGEIVLLVLEVEVAEGAGGLQAVLEVAGRAADEDVGLVGKLPDQPSLLKRFARVQPQVGHGGLLAGQQHAFAVSSVGDYELVF